MSAVRRLRFLQAMVVGAVLESRSPPTRTSMIKKPTPSLSYRPDTRRFFLLKTPSATQVRYLSKFPSNHSAPEFPPRSLRSLFSRQTFKTVYRQNPGELVFALVVLASTFTCMVYAVYKSFAYFYADFFTRFPPEIAKTLRRALYYADVTEESKLALEHFKLAIEQCNEHGLDPFSDEVTGIKIRLASWLERINNITGSVLVLDLVLKEDKKWLKFAESEPERLPRAPLPGTVIGEGEAAKMITKEDFEKWVRSNRSRILRRSIGISTKLGELLPHDQVLQNDKAHEHLLWAVETALGEFRRRSVEGVKDGEGLWMSQEEIGGALESLARSFEQKSQFDLALPLFFHALKLCHDRCHMAVIMNNIAVTFAQHPPRAPHESIAAVLSSEGDPSPLNAKNETWTRKELLGSAQRWATNAHRHAQEVAGDIRTPECDEACAVSLVNLGDIAALAGDEKEARRQYEQSIKVSQKHGFAETSKQAEAGLKRLTS